MRGETEPEVVFLLCTGRKVIFAFVPLLCLNLVEVDSHIPRATQGGVGPSMVFVSPSVLLAVARVPVASPVPGETSIHDKGA